MPLLNGNSPREVIVAAALTATVLVLVTLVRAFAHQKVRRARQTAGDIDDFLIDVANRTKIFLLLLPAIFLGIRALVVPLDLRRLLHAGAELSMIAQVALWFTGVVDFWIRRYRRSRLDSDPSAVMTVNVFRLAAVVAVWIVAVMLAIENLGFNVTTLVAGFGIGGVAVALATQNILADLFASLSIVVDKPFILGDSISVDGHSGTVEHIGLKTTRLRATGGEELILSNNDLLKSRIRNFKRMTQRRAVTRLVLSHETPVATLVRIPILLRAAVEKQERARFDRAHLVTMNEHGFEVELAYVVTPPDYLVFLDVQQSVNLEVLRMFDEENVRLARDLSSSVPRVPRSSTAE
jgi:small-conductance mechanosensitive channel